MSYIGASPTSVAFLTDQFSGNGTTTAFTMTVAPATTSSILVSITGVLQDPSTYSVSGTTLTFSAAPPSGTGNISVRYLGIPASGVTTTAYRTVTEFTATAGQTTFTPPSYTVGYIDVYRNGVMLGSADYTASNGTTVVLAAGATAGDLIETISFFVSSVLNAIPATAGSIGSSYIANGAVTPAQLTSTAQYTGYKNKLINGNFDVWQRGTSSSTNGVYGSADRYFQVIAGTTTIAQETSVVPAGSRYALKWTTASSGFAQIRQAIETANLIQLRGKTMIASALVRCTSGFSGNLVFESRYSNSSDAMASLTTDLTFTAITGQVTSSGYTRITAVLAVPSDAVGLYIGIVPTAVQSTGVTAYISQFQFEEGSTATSFDYRPYGTELALCQRYCIVYPASTYFTITAWTRSTDTNYEAGMFSFTPMRVAPTASAGGTFGFHVPNVWIRNTTTNVFTTSIQTVSFSGTVSNSGSTGVVYGTFYKNPDGLFKLEAEL